MNKLNAKGFGALEALLIVVILGIIGGAGFYVYNANKIANKGSVAPENTETIKPETKEETKNNDTQQPKSVVQSKISSSLSIENFSNACQSGAGLRACGEIKFKTSEKISEIKIMYGENKDVLDRGGFVVIRSGSNEAGYTVYDFRIDYSDLKQGTTYYYKATAKLDGQSVSTDTNTFTSLAQ